MKFNKLILKWYDQNKRDLPWRKTKNPYNIWVSEIILQQTRMEQGIYYYNRFISKFPNLESLATSEEKDVLLLWQGLGYYSRARNLHHTAKYIYYDLDSKFPKSYDKLINLKGIGDYTASAISSIVPIASKLDSLSFAEKLLIEKASTEKPLKSELISTVCMVSHHLPSSSISVFKTLSSEL